MGGWLAYTLNLDDSTPPAPIPFPFFFTSDVLPNADTTNPFAIDPSLTQVV